MISRSVVKSQSRPQAAISGTTRSAEASWKNLFGYRHVSASTCHRRDDETNIRWLNRVSVPRDAEHPIASRLRNEGMCTTLAGIGGDDIFNSPVSTKAASDTYMYFSQCFAGKTGEDNMPCKGVPSVVYIIASQPGSNSTLRRLSTTSTYCDAIEKTYTGRVRSPSTQVVYSP
jgi:hypothetical protein